MHPINEPQLVKTCYGTLKYAQGVVDSFDPKLIDREIQEGRIFPIFIDPNSPIAGQDWQRITDKEALKKLEEKDVVGALERVQTVYSEERKHYLSGFDGHKSDWGDCGGGIAHWR